MKSRQHHSGASLPPSNRRSRDQKQVVMLDQKTLHNMRQARDLLEELTGSRVQLIGDPVDLPCAGEVPPQDSQTLLLPICRQPDPQAAAKASALIISQLQLLVEVEMPNILQGGSKTKLQLVFDGFDADQALFANREVRAWARILFILNVPQAIGLLDEISFEFISTCCNRVKSTQPITGLPSESDFITVDLQPEWVIACYLSGIDATRKWPWWMDPSLDEGELAARLSYPT
ncbi:hypothetical protein [Noviherbaspirillum malthae]|uniref:hypothetical protein n=1 Tax=Noviherbaspirillum malthae TaxID=1260987 RepID=UPI00188FAC30|nr:hypothetical protein [Noviherbaspirillum malthae]